MSITLTFIKRAPVFSRWWRHFRSPVSWSRYGRNAWGIWVGPISLTIEWERGII